MLAKISIVLLAILGALWWSGIDFARVRQSVVEMSDENAQSMTGQGSDWG